MGEQGFFEKNLKNKKYNLNRSREFATLVL